MKKVVPFTKTITFRTMIAEITDIEVSHNLKLKENYEIEGDILIDGTYKMTDASQIEEEFHYKLPFMIDIDSKYNLDDLEITIGDFYFEIINEEDLKVNIEIDIDGIEEKKEEVIQKTKLSFEDETELLEVEDKYNDKNLLVRNDSYKELDEIPIPIEIEEIKDKLELHSNTNDPLTKLANEIEEDIKNENKILGINQNQFNNKNNIIEKESISQSTNVSSIFSSITSNEETFSTYYVYIVRETDTVEAIIDKYKTNREELQNYNDLTNVKVGSKLIIPCATNHE